MVPDVLIIRTHQQNNNRNVIRPLYMHSYLQFLSRKRRITAPTPETLSRGDMEEKNPMFQSDEELLENLKKRKADVKKLAATQKTWMKEHESRQSAGQDYSAVAFPAPHEAGPASTSVDARAFFDSSRENSDDEEEAMCIDAIINGSGSVGDESSVDDSVRQADSAIAESVTESITQPAVDENCRSVGSSSSEKPPASEIAEKPDDDDGESVEDEEDQSAVDQTEDSVDSSSSEKPLASDSTEKPAVGSQQQDREMTEHEEQQSVADNKDGSVDSSSSDQPLASDTAEKPANDYGTIVETEEEQSVVDNKDGSVGASSSDQPLAINSAEKPAVDNELEEGEMTETAEDGSEKIESA